MNETLYQLIYCSRSTVDERQADADREVAAILEKARRNNSRDGITGVLVFTASSYAQVLEGPLTMLERTFERIQCDRRHGDVVVLGLRPAARREFPDWSMAFAGRLTEPGTVSRLASACHTAGQDGAEAVLNMLRSLVHREEDWAAVA